MRYRPFPKRDGKIDKDKVRALYLAEPHFHWRDFCAAHNFNDELRAEFSVRSWQTEWVERKSLEQQEMVAPKVLALRGKIVQGRVDVIGAQIETNALLRGLLNENLHCLKAGASQPMMRAVVADELASLVKTNEVLIKCEFATLMMSAKTTAINGFSDALPMNQSGSSQDDAIPQIEVETLGVPIGATAEEVAASLASYFDQLPRGAEEAVNGPVAENVESPQHLP